TRGRIREIELAVDEVRAVGVEGANRPLEGVLIVRQTYFLGGLMGVLRLVRRDGRHRVGQRLVTRELRRIAGPSLGDTGIGEATGTGRLGARGRAGEIGRVVEAI